MLFFFYIFLPLLFKSETSCFYVEVYGIIVTADDVNRMMLLLLQAADDLTKKASEVCCIGYLVSYQVPSTLVLQ